MIQALQDIAITAGSFLLVLSVVVFVHELGHFRAARSCKVAVDTFAIGFGRTLAAWRDRDGVQWKVGALPLGGYVKFVDDGDVASASPAQALDTAALAQARRQGLFHAQPVGVRAFVAAAGPLANFAFAILAFAVLLLAYGKDVTQMDTLVARVDGVAEGSPAAAAGIKPGDVVVAIDDRMIASFGAMQAIVSESAGKPLRVIVERGGARVPVVVTPKAQEFLDEGGAKLTRGVLGIRRDTRPDERTVDRYNPIEALGGGAVQTWRIISSTFAYLGNIFSGKASPEHLAGPLGIMDMSGKVAKSAGGGAGSTQDQIANAAAALLGWAATLSVAVGIVNLLPVPILDGGHLLFYAVEAARGRPLDPKAQAIGFRAGLALLGSLFLFATWNDLQRLNVLEFLHRILS